MEQMSVWEYHLNYIILLLDYSSFIFHIVSSLYQNKLLLVSVAII